MLFLRDGVVAIMVGVLGSCASPDPEIISEQDAPVSKQNVQSVPSLPDPVLALLMNVSAESKAHTPRRRQIEAFLYSDRDRQREVAQWFVATDAHDWPDDYRGVFLRAIAAEVLVQSSMHPSPPSVSMAQAILESGWGRSSLARRYNNLFGMKARPGHQQVTLGSSEFTDGAYISTRAAFEVFDEWGESIEQHAVLLQDERYWKAQRNWDDWRAYIVDLSPVYASDPQYIQRLTTLINKYRLDRWDALVEQSVVGSSAVDALTDNSAQFSR